MLKKYFIFRHSTLILPCFLLFGLLLGACGSGNSSSSESGMLSYKETKSMVLDILKSEEGQKTIKKASEKQEEQSGSIKMLGTGSGQQIKLAVKDVLTDPNYATTIKEMMTDPKFAGDFAKALKKENKQIQKDLIKDPEYQTQVINAMKNPEFEKMLLDTLKSTPYRKQTMTIMKESLESPLFRVELMELMKKVMEEESKPKKKSEGGEKSNGGGQQSGGQ